MTFGRDPFGTLAIAELPGAGSDNSLLNAWQALTGRVFLYELTTFARSIFGSWIVPFGTYPFATVPAEANVAAEVVLRFSDTGFVSLPTDSVPNTSFDGSVQSGLQLTATAPASPEASRRVTLQIGTFSIANADAAMDTYLRSYSVDGRKCRVLLGLAGKSYDTFTPIYTGRMLQWGNNSTNVIVQVQDESYRLEKPMQTDLYDGSGGYNGGADTAGKPRPITLGQVQNISPLLIDAANLIYQFHHRAVSSVDNVYDRGAALTPGADYATYDALVAATVAGGTFATCLAFGLIRLGSTPAGLVTIDAHGDAAGGYIDTTGPLIKRVFKDYGGLADTDLDLASITDFGTGLPGTIGWFQDAGTLINVTDALEALTKHCAGWWGALPTGVFQIGRMQAPTADAFYLALSESDDIALEILEPLQGTFPPRFRQRVEYAKLWTTQQETDLAGSVTAARRSYLAQPARISYSQDLSVQNSFLLAIDPPPLPCLFYNKSDADSLAAALLALYKVARQTVRITLDLKGLGARLSSTVIVTHRRLNGGSPTPMLLMDATIQADQRQTQLVLWG